MTGVKECKTEICHARRDAACCVRKSKSKTQNTKLQAQFQLALSAATSDNSKTSGRCTQRPYHVSVLAQSPFPLFSFLFSLFSFNLTRLLAHQAPQVLAPRSPLIRSPLIRSPLTAPRSTFPPLYYIIMYASLSVFIYCPFYTHFCNFLKISFMFLWWFAEKSYLCTRKTGTTSCNTGGEFFALKERVL